MDGGSEEMHAPADRALGKFLLFLEQLYIIPAVRATIHALAGLVTFVQITIPPRF